MVKASFYRVVIVCLLVNPVIWIRFPSGTGWNNFAERPILISVGSLSTVIHMGQPTMIVFTFQLIAGCPFNNQRQRLNRCEFCCTLLYVHSSIAIILMGKRELVALLNLSSWCLVMVERLFLAVPWGCLRFVIVVFPA